MFKKKNGLIALCILGIIFLALAIDFIHVRKVALERFEVYKKALSALQDVVTRSYFPGVSDCSYCGLPAGAQSPVYQANTPLWGTDYRFDMEALARLQIPFFIFGPWGKDLHQIGERVNRQSLTEEYPEVLRKLLRCVWLSE